MKRLLSEKTTRRSMRPLAGWLAAAAFAAVLALLAGRAADAPDNPSVLVLHEDDAGAAWFGRIHAMKLENLLGHFEADVVIKPLGDYRAGDLAAHDAAFYLGSTWSEEELDGAFVSDLGAGIKPFVWVGLNLWRLAWDRGRGVPDPAFEQRWGFRLLKHSSAGHPAVLYKGVELEKDPFDTGLSRIEVVDPARVEVFAEALDADGGKWPYAVRSGNFWFVADMPLVATTYRNRMLAFADLLHDMLGIHHHEQHRAFFRVEDVSPESDPEILGRLGDVLEDLDVPFAVSVIPEFRDWSGVFNNGVPRIERVEGGSAFGLEMRRWVDAGGVVLQHGTTHQIDGLLNPFSGVSGDDYEFFRVSAGDGGEIELDGPLERESVGWVRRRVLRGKALLSMAGLAPVGWVTPHYLATPLAYRVFAEVHPFACERAIVFSTNGDGIDEASELNAPYVTRDGYGLKRIPETIGYIDPWGWNGQPPSTPQELLRRAEALKVVRDGWAGFYFHWYLDPADLREVVEGLKRMGFGFVELHGGLN
jgi:uncharacterized protein YdaL